MSNEPRYLAESIGSTKIHMRFCVVRKHNTLHSFLSTENRRSCRNSYWPLSCLFGQCAVYPTISHPSSLVIDGKVLVETGCGVQLQNKRFNWCSKTFLVAFSGPHGVNLSSRIALLPILREVLNIVVISIGFLSLGPDRVKDQQGPCRLLAYSPYACQMSIEYVKAATKAETLPIVIRWY